RGNGAIALPVRIGAGTKLTDIGQNEVAVVSERRSEFLQGLELRDAQHAVDGECAERRRMLGVHVSMNQLRQVRDVRAGRHRLAGGRTAIVGWPSFVMSAFTGTPAPSGQ